MRRMLMRRMLWICAVLPALLLLPLANGAEPLLTAVASDGVESTSIVSNLAARSQYYLLFSGINMVEVLRNPFLDKGPGAGPLVVDYLASKGVGILVAGGFGPPMLEALNRRGMKHFLCSGVAQEAAERTAAYLKPKENSGGGNPQDGASAGTGLQG